MVVVAVGADDDISLVAVGIEDLVVVGGDGVGLEVLPERGQRGFL